MFGVWRTRWVIARITSRPVASKGSCHNEAHPYLPSFNQGRKSRAQTPRDLCRDRSLFIDRTCADKAREGERSLELQNAIQGPGARSRNAILRFLAMAILIRHFICSLFLRSRPFATASFLKRSPKGIHRSPHSGYGV